MTPNHDATGGAPDGIDVQNPGAVASVLAVAERLFGPGVVDEVDLAAAEAFDLPGADLSSEEFTEQVLPAQADEFTCASCFLVRHRSQIVANRGGLLYCTDCEG